MGAGGAIASDVATAFGHDMLTTGMYFNNRNWDLRHAKRKHQYEVADLRAAGYNPMLTFDGSGTAVPSSPAPSYNGSANVAQSYAQKEQLKIAKQQSLADLKIKEKTAKNIEADTKLKGDRQREIGTKILDYEDLWKLRGKEGLVKDKQILHYEEAIKELAERVNLTSAQAKKMMEEANKIKYYNQRRAFGSTLIQDPQYGKWAQFLMFLISEMKGGD